MDSFSLELVLRKPVASANQPARTLNMIPDSRVQTGIMRNGKDGTWGEQVCWSGSKNTARATKALKLQTSWARKSTTQGKTTQTKVYTEWTSHLQQHINGTGGEKVMQDSLLVLATNKVPNHKLESGYSQTPK